MERYDMIWQPKTGTNAAHVMAASQRIDLATARDYVSREAGGYWTDLITAARGVCVAIGLDPDEQPITLVDDVYQDERGYAIRAGGDDFLYAMATLWIGHEPEYPGVEFVPERMFENHYVNITPEE